MREIKFRAWCKDTNEWVGYMLMIDRHVYATRPNVELMQYTGLKDKNGKEIYEGDIILCIWGNTGGVIFHQEIVEWSEVFCGFHPWIDYDINSGIYNGDSPEIIGNIYENPELLK